MAYDHYDAVCSVCKKNLSLKFCEVLYLIRILYNEAVSGTDSERLNPGLTVRVAETARSILTVTKKL